MSFNRTRINPSRVSFAALSIVSRQSERDSIRWMWQALAPVFCALFCLFNSTLSTLAQDNFKHTQNTADSSLRGAPQVDPSTLGMTLQIPLGEYQGRNGVNLPVTISYGSKQWRIETVEGFPGQSTYHTQSEARYAEHSMSGWTSSLEPPEIQYLGGEQPFNSLGDSLCTFCVGVPAETPYYIDRLLVHMPDGSSHELRKSDTPVLGPGLGLGGLYYAVDSSRLKFDANTATLYMPDGSRYLLAAPGGVQFIDRNGNTLSYDSTYKQWTDTLGRVISLPPLQNSAPADVQYWLPGFGGTNRTITFLYRYLSDVRTDPSQPLRYKGNKSCPGYPESTISPSLFTSVPVLDSVCWGGPVFNPVVLWQIVLPNNSAYIFTYNIYGEIDKVALPTGGYQRFRYEAVDGLSDLTDPYRQANRGVVEHWISAKGDGSDEVRWQYSAVNDGLTKVTTTVIGPNGAKSERLIHKGVHTSLPTPHFGYEDSRAGRAFEERTYSAGGQMIRRTLVNWTMDSAQLPTPYQHVTVMRNPRGTKKVEILLDTGGNALATTTTTSYDNDLNEIAANRYDYVSVSATTGQTGDINSFPLGTLLRTEESTYLVNDASITQATRDAYRARHLISLPSSTRVKQGSVVVAETQFKYDESAYPVLTYGATPTGWTNPAVNERGNVTTTRSWLNVSGSTVQTYPNGSFLETHAQYDQCGSARKAWDAKGALSQVSYTDNFSDSINRNTFAYATSLTTPVPDSSGYYGSNVSFTSSSRFDFQSGKVVTTTDANNKTTSYFYTDDGGVLDSLQRLRKVTLPDGLGETKYEFGDTPGNLYTRTLTKQNATTWLENRTNFDGLGRAKRSGHYEGPGSWSVKDTEYDTLGRVKRVTNPYFAANLSGATPGAAEWTTTTYDDLNRVLTVTAPDGSKVETTYSGVQVTVKDPANKKRRSVTDAMGRLAQVVEDPDGSAYQTNYTYNTQGNLTIVNQGGQYRYFFYDSLGRLVRAKNPEQSAYGSLNLTNPPAYNNNWSLGYSYDGNNNPMARTDARGVTASYGYDAINRNIWTSYSDGTPTLERHYDGAINNGKGRLSYHVNYTVNPATGGAGYSRLVISGYDALGRVTGQSQGFLANDGSTWKDFPVSRTYDMASNVLTQSYPSTRSVNYSYGAGGRLSSAGGNLGGTPYAYADTISYNAAGQTARERFGTGAPLYLNLHYNNRLQLVDTRLGDSSTDEWNWSRGALISYYGPTAVLNWNPFHSDTENNGNVRRQLHYVPLAGGGSVISQNDDYNYDGLNRITSISEAQQNSGGQWSYGVTSQTFTYDRWGNRLSVAGYNAQSWDATEASLTNRLKLPSGTVCTGTKNGLCYDAAGNLIFDNQLGSTGDRTYDAEGRIITAAGGGLNKYVYDAEGKRVRRQVGAQQFWQVYGIDGELVAEYLWNGTTATLQKEYAYRGGEMLIVAEGATVRWLVTDHLGTPRMIADQTGSLSGMRRHDYYPFGEENLAGGTIRTTTNGYQADNVRQKFTGYEHDGETDLDFAEARYCSTKQGRFTSPDPLVSSASSVEPQSWNRYSYVGNRPLVVTDPSGLKWFYNPKTNKYGWCNCDTLNDADKADGWEEITADSSGLVKTFSNGDVIYKSAAGALILLPHNNKRYDNLTAELMRLARLREIEFAKENAEEKATAVLLDFIGKAGKGAAVVLSGGSVTLVAALGAALSQAELFDSDTNDTGRSGDGDWFLPDQSPYSPENVDRRRSALRESLGLEPDPKTGIPDQRPGRNIKGTHEADTTPHHGTGERNVGTKEEHKRIAPGSQGRPRRR